MRSITRRAATDLEAPADTRAWNIAGNDGDDAQHYQKKAVREAVRKLREAEHAQKR
jgi:hypothetical protein